MRYLFLVLSMLFILNGYSQSMDDKSYEEGIYKTDTDYINHHLTLAFNKNDEHHFKMKDPLFHHQLLINAPDTTYKFYYDEIWGYRDKNKDFRLYNNHAFQVIYQGRICIYTVVDITPETNSTAEYFSTALSSPIHELSKKNLIDVYHSDTAFVNKIKQMPLTKSIFKRDHKHQIYKFVSWLH